MAKEKFDRSSNNTNKLSPQELPLTVKSLNVCSNNTNKLSPQEPFKRIEQLVNVQIIQINLALKNSSNSSLFSSRFK